MCSSHICHICRKARMLLTCFFCVSMKVSFIFWFNHLGVTFRAAFKFWMRLFPSSDIYGVKRDIFQGLQGDEASSPWTAAPNVSVQPGCAAAPPCWSWRPHSWRQPCTPHGALLWSRGRPAWWSPGTRPSDSETESRAPTAWRASWRTAPGLWTCRIDLFSFYSYWFLHLRSRQDEVQRPEKNNTHFFEMKRTQNKKNNGWENLQSTPGNKNLEEKSFVPSISCPKNSLSCTEISEWLKRELKR